MLHEHDRSGVGQDIQYRAVSEGAASELKPFCLEVEAGRYAQKRCVGHLTHGSEILFSQHSATRGDHDAKGLGLDITGRGSSAAGAGG